MSGTTPSSTSSSTSSSSSSSSPSSSQNRPAEEPNFPQRAQNSHSSTQHTTVGFCSSSTTKSSSPHGSSQLKFRPVNAYLTTAHFAKYFTDPPNATELQDPRLRETAVASFVEQEPHKTSPSARSHFRKLVFTNRRTNQPRIFLAAVLLQEKLALMAKISDPNCIVSIPTGSYDRLSRSLAAELGHQFPKWFKGVKAASLFGVYSKIISKAHELERFQASAEANGRAGWTPTRMSRIAMDLLELKRATQAGLRGRTSGERAVEAVRNQKLGAHQLPESCVDDESLEKQMREGAAEKEQSETRPLKREITARAESEDKEECSRNMAKEGSLESERVVKPVFKDDNFLSNNATVDSHTRVVSQASNTDDPSLPPCIHATWIRADAAGSSQTGIGRSMVQRQPCKQPQRAGHPSGGQDLDEERVTGSSGMAKATMMKTTEGLLNVVDVQVQTIQDLIFDVVRLEEADVIKSQKIKDSTDLIAVLKKETAVLREEAIVLKKETVKYNETVELKEKTDGLKKEIVGLKEKSDGLKNETAGLKEKTAGLKEKTDSLKKETVGLKEMIAGLKKETVGLKKKTDDMEKENVELKEKIDGLKRENEGLKKETVGLKDETAGFKEEISQLNSQGVRQGSPSKWMTSLLSFRTSCSRWFSGR